MRLVFKDFCRGNPVLENTQREPGKDEEPSDHNASVTLSKGEREGKLGGEVSYTDG